MLYYFCCKRGKQLREDKPSKSAAIKQKALKNEKAEGSSSTNV